MNRLLSILKNSYLGSENATIFPWRYLIAFAVLILCTVPAFLSIRLQLITFGILLTICSGFYLFHNLEIGIYLLITTCLFIPFGINTGTQTQLNLALLLLFFLIGLWLLKMVLNRRLLVYSYRPFIPLYALMVSALISFGFGQIRWFISSNAPIQSQLGGLAMFWAAAGAFILAAHVIKNLKWLERYIILFVIVIALISIVENVTSGSYPRILEFFLSITSQFGFGSIGWLWAVTLAFSMGIYNRSLSLIWRIILIICFILLFYALAIGSREWTSGWFPCLVSIGVVIFVSLPGRLRILALFAGALILFFGYSYLYSEIFSGNEYSVYTRFAAIQSLSGLIKTSPIFGLGMANYYWYTPLFSILGYNVQFNSHNNYIDILAQTGIVGLVCFVWFIYEYTKLGLSTLKKVPSGFPRAFVYACLGGIAGTAVAGMLGDWVIPFVYNIGFLGFRFSMVGWIFLGGLVAIAQTYETSTIKID